MVSQMLEEYERINASELAKKSPQQFKKWKVRRQRGHAVTFPLLS
jgi:hypothetical protein